MSLINQFTHFFKHHGLLPIKQSLLVAVSGGMDSVVLLELCHQAGYPFSIAHCNFQLRGDESERDEKFVRDLATRYEAEVMVNRFTTAAYAAEKKLSVQEAARELRYNWFAQLLSEKGFSYTLVAHHADDNIETVLMNFFRGTGLQGLTAIPPVNLSPARLLRPLLHIRETHLQEFAHQHKLKWVEDSSNASVKYTRNLIRHELIPLLRGIYPRVEENLLDNIERFTAINELYRLSVTEWKKKICIPQDNEVRIPVLKLMKFKNTALVFEIIRDFGFGEKQVDELIRLGAAESGKFIENEQYRIIRHGKWFIIAPVAGGSQTVVIDRGEATVSFPGGTLEIRQKEFSGFKLNKSEWVAQLDAKHIEFPLLLRKWKQGDYFYPLGMRKKKKLSRFFIDLKLSKNRKEELWVLESNKKILWIPGLRIDDRFKITDSTKSFLEITFKR